MNSTDSNFNRRRFLRSLGMTLPWVTLAPAWASTSVIHNPAVDLDYVSRELPLKRRSEWACVEPNVKRLHPAINNIFHRITVHHTGLDVITATSDSAVARCLDGVLGGHLNRDFGDIGYHFLVDYAGRVWEGRSLRYWGAHVSGQNEYNIGIVLLGNFERQRPSRMQLISMETLIGLLRQRFAIQKGQVYGHMDLGQTLCPGKYLYPRVERLNRLA
jgi:hypothetical protein